MTVRDPLKRRTGLLGVVALLLALLAAGAPPTDQALAHKEEGADSYANPLTPAAPGIGNGLVESCADPSVIYGQEDEGAWYMYCTADPLNSGDRTGDGFNFRLIPTLRSTDLVNWEYVDDAFDTRPGYATAGAGLWAPEIEYYPETGRYHLYYTVTETTIGGSAIGVAWSDTPTGPWTHSAAPVVAPSPPDCCPNDRRWTFDPEVLRTDGPDYIYYGSYFGGISVRVLSEDGLTSDPTTQDNVAVANKYEGAEVVERGGYYYLFVSATDCCRGPLTGYSVFVGRSQSPTGPFLDRDGVDLNDDEGPPEADPTDARVGGTPVITMNGNRWVGLGHNTVFEDFDGQWWTIYHGIDQEDPYFEGGVNIFPGGCGNEAQPPPAGDRCGDLNKRPALLDPLDWVDGWPVLRGGYGPSDRKMPAPAAQPGDETDYRPRLAPQHERRQLLTRYSDQFEGGDLSERWTWVRPPAADTYSVADGAFHFKVQIADLFVESNNASVLTRPAPNHDYIVETRVRVNVPDEGCCFNFVQGGLVIYDDDDNFIKLVNVSIFNTRQTEFAKEEEPVPFGHPRYGNTVVGPPGEWTYLRIAVDFRGREEHYTAYTSLDGQRWTRGATWVHSLGRDARIGLVAMGQQPPPPGETAPTFTADFDYVKVYRSRLKD